MSDWPFYALLGVGTGALYAAFAMSVIITYRGSGVVNFAVGAMAMIPAMVFAELRASGDLVIPIVGLPNRFRLGDPMSFVPAAALGMAVGLIVAAVIYVVVIRSLRSAPPVTMLVATVGLTLVLQALATRGFGNVTLRVSSILPDDVISLGGRPFPVDRLWLLVAVCVLALGVGVVERFTRFGLATRAAFLNEKGAILLGLNPTRIGLTNWLFAAALAGSVGIVGSSLGGVSPFTFSLFVVPALGAALAARLQSISVAVGAAVAIGSFEAIAVHIVAQQQVPRFFLGGISALVPFVVIVGALILVGKRLPNRAAILERAQVPVVLARADARVWALTLAIALIVVVSGDPTVRFAALQTMFVATLLMSIGVLTGLIGQVSLAQLALAGFSAFMLSRFDGPLGFPLAPMAAVAVTIVVGTLVSIPALRVRGVQFAIVTFSLAVVFDELLFRSPTFVGRGGIAQVDAPSIGGFEFGIFDGEQFPARVFGVVMLVVTALCAAVVQGVRRGPLGRRFLAVRSNERAAASAGIDVAQTKVLAAAIASLLAGVAGLMFAYKAMTFNGGGLSAQDGLLVLALGYVGGVGSIAGAVVGGILAPSGLFIVVILGGGSSPDQFLITGIALVLVAMKFPQGIAGSWQMLRSRIESQRQRDGSDPPGHETREAPVVMVETARTVEPGTRSGTSGVSESSGATGWRP
ncbi:ABC transporter permease [Ilumatobacter nonamiensis]|uniref:ABC transporter permease n=1 Tax=Ilumatobacter nonamiensis TaxID=467093 RepID=UPI00034B2A6C|nr:ABC transporter permease [Ilumatobacter nonamiensis]